MGYKNHSEIEIELIDGMREAKLISKAVHAVVSLKKKTAMLIDIGGGSTEITVTDNNKIIYRCINNKICFLFFNFIA